MSGLAAVLLLACLLAHSVASGAAVVCDLPWLRGFTLAADNLLAVPAHLEVEGSNGAQAWVVSLCQSTTIPASGGAFCDTSRGYVAGFFDLAKRNCTLFDRWPTAHAQAPFDHNGEPRSVRLTAGPSPTAPSATMAAQCSAQPSVAIGGGANISVSTPLLCRTPQPVTPGPTQAPPAPTPAPQGPAQKAMTALLVIACLGLAAAAAAVLWYFVKRRFPKARYAVLYVVTCGRINPWSTVATSDAPGGDDDTLERENLPAADINDSP